MVLQILEVLTAPNENMEEIFVNSVENSASYDEARKLVNSVENSASYDEARKLVNSVETALHTTKRANLKMGILVLLNFQTTRHTVDCWIWIFV